MCGENSQVIHVFRCSIGSPPRVRGKQARNLELQDTERITPACAGKTKIVKYLLWSHRDHPRVCGENLAPCKTCSLITGSPPRVRGKHGRKIHHGLQRRITPACAGKTHPRGVRAAAEKDHPRVCGENWEGARADGGQVGSPPRVRGKLTSILIRNGCIGITPACAGKTIDLN